MTERALAREDERGASSVFRLPAQRVLLLLLCAVSPSAGLRRSGDFLHFTPDLVPYSEIVEERSPTFAELAERWLNEFMGEVDENDVHSQSHSHRAWHDALLSQMHGELTEPEMRDAMGRISTGIGLLILLFAIYIIPIMMCAT